MEKNEAKSDIDIFEENRELKQEIVGLKKENAKLETENRALKEQIVTSMDKNSCANEKEKQAPENKESPKVPAWLPDVLDWIKRTELALSSLSTACWAFNQYCWPKLHGKVKPHIVRKLTFSHEWDEEGNSRAKLEKDNQVSIPIAFTNPPEYIIGFKEIKFCFLDGQALKFIRTILPLLNDITILFDLLCSGDNPKFGPISHLMALFAPKTYELGFEGYAPHGYLPDFSRQFPNFLNGIQSICFTACANSDLIILAEWLSMPPKDGGKPKVACAFILHQSDANMLFDRIEKKFLDSIEPHNFIALIESNGLNLPIFIMENEVTGEIFELYRKQDSDNETQHFLVRHRKGGEAQRANWEEEFNRAPNTTILMP